MTAMYPIGDTEDEDIDPRLLRSRARLLDAATTLLTTGGVDAVTIDAVTRVSKVARTTLYRHFPSSAHLLAATFERLLPQVIPPLAAGTFRNRLIELLRRQAKLVAEAPHHVTALAWVALDATDAEGSPQAGGAAPSSLRARIVDQYRRPFDDILQSPEARAELGDFDLTLVLAQLLGPIVFGRLTGIRTISEQDCVEIVDDFLSVHRSTRSDLGGQRDRPCR